MMKAGHMSISTNEEQDNKIVYNDPAFEVLREGTKQISITTYPITETSIPFKKQFLENKNNFYLRVN